MTSPHHPYGPGHGQGWPGNELEETLAASAGQPHAGARLLQVLGRSQVWVPLPEGGSRESADLDLPTLTLDDGVYVPVFSSEAQFLAVAGGRMPFAVAPAVEVARGLPPQVGMAVNPEGAIGVPLPPPAVAELCRHAPGERGVPGVARGARVRLFEPDWQDDPTGLLAAVRHEFAGVDGLRSARRALASTEGDPPALFVGVELDHLDPRVRQAAHDALARALSAQPVRWPVQLVLLDAADDPVTQWMHQCVRPFWTRESAHG